MEIPQHLLTSLVYGFAFPLCVLSNFDHSTLISQKFLIYCPLLFHSQRTGQHSGKGYAETARNEVLASYNSVSIYRSIRYYLIATMGRFPYETLKHRF